MVILKDHLDDNKKLDVNIDSIIPIDLAFQQQDSESLLVFENFHLRCDKSDPSIVNQDPWNWTINRGERLSIFTQNAYLRYQIIGVLAELIPSVSGVIHKQGSLSWPIGGEGGLDLKLRACNGVEFLCEVYGDCLRNSGFPLDDFWSMLESISIEKKSILKELNKKQKDFFFLAVSALFGFDINLVPEARYFNSKSARPLKEILSSQLINPSTCLISTTKRSKFYSEFCNQGLVLGSMGELLFRGSCDQALSWFNDKIAKNSDVDQDDDQFNFGEALTNDQARQNESDVDDS